MRPGRRGTTAKRCAQPSRPAVFVYVCCISADAQHVLDDQPIEGGGRRRRAEVDVKVAVFVRVKRGGEI